MTVGTLLLACVFTALLVLLWRKALHVARLEHRLDQIRILSQRGLDAYVDVLDGLKAGHHAQKPTPVRLSHGLVNTSAHLADIHRTAKAALRDASKEEHP